MRGGTAGVGWEGEGRDCGEGVGWEGEGRGEKGRGGGGGGEERGKDCERVRGDEVKEGWGEEDGEERGEGTGVWGCRLK